MDTLRAKGWKVDYLAVCQQHDLKEVDHWGSDDLVILVAATLGTTRLIDNMEVRLTERIQ